MSEQCKGSAPKDFGFGFRRCTRKAVQDGYCKQHHPDIVKARRAEQDAKWEAKWAAHMKERKLRDAAPMMLEALRLAALALAHAEESSPGLYIEAYNAVDAAIQKATT